jgi:glycolate oxidase iron-sulfur subunit
MLDNLEQLTLSCMRCGECKPACPVFREVGEEGASPRGRVRLIRGVSSGEVELSARYQELVGKCIGCRACADDCPSGIEPNAAVLNARCHLVLEKGLPPVKRFLFRRALRARRLFPLSTKLIGLLQRASFIGSRYSPARLLLPIIGLPFGKSLPYFQLKTFIERTPDIVPAESRKRRVAYFVGCGANLILPEIGEAVVGLLNRFGAEVVIPREQMCCGMPVFHSGDFEGARMLAEHNLGVFSKLDVDAVIVGCGSCGSALKKEWRDLLGLEVPDEFTSKVYDISEFLADRLGIWNLGFGIPDFPPRGSRITYHDPCHLARGMGIRSQPRRLLSSLPGVKFVEAAEADKCCGGGGAYSLYHPDISRKIGARKAESIVNTEADIVATGCPSCIIQLREMLSRAGAGQAVEHTACLLWKALKETVTTPRTDSPSPASTR